MDGASTSESASSLPWLWVIQAVACCKNIHISTLNELVNMAPVGKDDFCHKTRELIALKCLEDLYDSAQKIHSDDNPLVNLDSRPGFDFSTSCEDVLHQIMDKVPLSDKKAVRAELLKWDVSPFIKHKRSTIRCDLELLKESISKGTHPHASYLREKGGLVYQNSGEPSKRQ